MTIEYRFHLCFGPKDIFNGENSIVGCMNESSRQELHILYYKDEQSKSPDIVHVYDYNIAPNFQALSLYGYVKMQGKDGWYDVHIECVPTGKEWEDRYDDSV